MEVLKRFYIVAIFVSLLASSSFAQSQKELEKAFLESYTLETNGEYSKAVITLTKVYNKDSYELNLRLAWLNYLSGQYTESMTYYRRSISLKPLSIEALLGLTYPASAMGNWEMVIKSYLQILKIDKNNYTANLKLAQIYLSREEYAKAEPYFTLLLNQYPFTYDVVLNTAWNNYYLGKFRAAKILFQKVLLLSPNDISATAGLKKIQ